MVLEPLELIEKFWFSNLGIKGQGRQSRERNLGNLPLMDLEKTQLKEGIKECGKVLSSKADSTRDGAICYFGVVESSIPWRIRN
jgi:hypothetical protein